MKAIMTAVAAAMLLTTPIVTADSADARHRHRGWDNHHGGIYYRQPRRSYHRKYVRHRHHRWVNRGGVVIKIIVFPGQPYYYGCGGYCW